MRHKPSEANQDHENKTDSTHDPKRQPLFAGNREHRITARIGAVKLQKPIRDADELVLDAVELHEQCRKSLRAAKDFAFACGMKLLAAQKTLGDDVAFGEFLLEYEKKIPRSTCYRYMRFARDMMEWAQLENPRLKKIQAIQIHAKDMVMQSAVGFLELCREAAQILRPLEGGGHRSEKWQEGKAHGQQIYFNFDLFSDQMQNLERLNYKALRQVPRDVLQSTRASLARTLQQMDSLLAHGELLARGEP